MANPPEQQRKKRKLEELAAASSGTQKLSALGFVVNPKRNDTAVSSLDKPDDTAAASSSTSNSSNNQQYNPCDLDVSITNSGINHAQPLQNFPEDISKGKLDVPVQPKLYEYPWRFFGMTISVKRRFQSCFFVEFPWMEYSVQQDACYCFCCRYWSKESSPFAEPIGFSDWQHATGQKYGLTLHNSSVEHLRCMLEWDQFKVREKEGTHVVNLIDKAAITLRDQNRYYIKTLAEAIIFCAKQEIALRGHEENEESDNKGNFLELIDVISRHDEKFAARLRSLLDNATYLSPQIQNDIALCIASCISDATSKVIEESGMFALLVDDTKDISKTEQTSIVLRYFDKSNNSIIERFLGFFQPNGLDAESLVICITDALKKHNVNINNCIAQAYDGASVMSGDIGGVQRKIQELVPHAIYVHCYAHRVNLVLVNVCKNESIARDFFYIVQSLYVYMSSAVPHAQFLATQAGIDYNNVVIELKRIIDTRWTCQYAAIASIRRTFAAILKTLEELSVSGGDWALMAIGLLHQIQNFKFILSLEMFHSLFQLTTTLAESLQNSSVLISTAQKLVSAVSSNLQAFRDKPDAWAGIWAASVAVCEAHAIPVEHEVLPTEGIRPRRKRKIPQALNEFVVEASE